MFRSFSTLFLFNYILLSFLRHFILWINFFRNNSMKWFNALVSGFFLSRSACHDSDRVYEQWIFRFISSGMLAFILKGKWRASYRIYIMILNSIIPQINNLVQQQLMRFLNITCAAKRNYLMIYCYGDPITKDKNEVA